MKNKLKIAIRITPTKNEGSFFINELIKKDGIWVNKPSETKRAVPVYIDETTTVFELMDKLED